MLKNTLALHPCVFGGEGGAVRGGGAAIAFLGRQLHKFGRSLIQISQKALPFFGYESVTAFRQAPVEPGSGL